MKTSKLVIAFFLLGLGVASSFILDTDKKIQNIKVTNIQCDYMEESRLKVALQQCADLVTSYTWEELDKEKRR